MSRQRIDHSLNCDPGRALSSLYLNLTPATLDWSLSAELVSRRESVMDTVLILVAFMLVGSAIWGWRGTRPG